MQTNSETALVLSMLNIWMAEDAVLKWHERAAERMPIEVIYPRVVAELAAEGLFAKSSPYYRPCLGKRVLELWKRGMAAAGDPYPGRGQAGSSSYRAAGADQAARTQP